MTHSFTHTTEAGISDAHTHTGSHSQHLMQEHCFFFTLLIILALHLSLCCLFSLLRSACLFWFICHHTSSPERQPTPPPALPVRPAILDLSHCPCVPLCLSLSYYQPIHVQHMCRCSIRLPCHQMVKRVSCGYEFIYIVI